MMENGFFDRIEVEIITTESGEKEEREKVITGYLADPWNVMECTNLAIFMLQGGYEIFLQNVILTREW